MSDLQTKLATLLRPRLLVRAARHACQSYNRARHLPRLLGPLADMQGTQVAARLADMEADHDDRRTAGDASYSPSRHIDVLTALMAEAEILAQATILKPKNRRLV